METEDYLAYFNINPNELANQGVKDMKWGEHHARRMARADANEFAKARVYHAQGAGTRRKLIKAKVETRSQNSHYKDEFEQVLSGQNAEKRSPQGSGSRMSNDVSLQDVEDFVSSYMAITHQGVKGMHWGMRRSSNQRAPRLEKRIARTKARINEHETAISNIKSHVADAEKNGSDSQLFKKQYGVHSNTVFQTIHGKSRSQALNEHKEYLQSEIEDHHRPALYALQGHLASLERKHAKTQ